MQVHLRDSMVVIHCGQGSQKIRWLGTVAIHRLDPDFGMETGLPKEIRFKSGVLPNQDAQIVDELTDDCHVMVVLEGNCSYLTFRGLCQGGGKEKEKGQALTLIHIINLTNSSSNSCSFPPFKVMNFKTRPACSESRLFRNNSLSSSSSSSSANSSRA